MSGAAQKINTNGAASMNNWLGFIIDANSSNINTVAIYNNVLSINSNTTSLSVGANTNIINYHNLGSIDTNSTGVNFNINTKTLETCKLIADEDLSIRIADFSTHDSLTIEIYQGITVKILDEKCPSVPITLGKNAKVDFLYEGKEFTFTNHYRDKMSFQDINILAKIANLPHKEFAKILSNDYTLEEIKDIADKYKAIDKEALNLFIGQNYKLFYSSYQTKNPFENHTKFLNFKLVEKSLEKTILNELAPEIKYHISSYLEENISDVNIIGNDS
ncbi:MAG TPA: hypothetical protein LFW21_00125 [Rickettsia endosymbiont of Pyrocoelia pectoralis]|nr:hypothetical protein [Rickettsia endosymbiont of Pyrocoelia pectoralis]